MRLHMVKVSVVYLARIALLPTRSWFIVFGSRLVAFVATLSIVVGLSKDVFTRKLWM